MAIFAGMITVLGLIAILTMVHVTAHGFCTTLFDSLHRNPVGDWHPTSVFVSVQGSMTAEDLCQLCHSSSAVSWFMEPGDRFPGVRCKK